MRKIWRPVLALLLAAGLLLGLYNGLLGVRNAKEEAELQSKMETLLPGSKVFAEESYTGEDENIQAVYRGENGYVVATKTQGYAGTIAMLIGVSDEGSVTGLQIRKMEETYGLGGRALTDVEFLKQFIRSEGDSEVGVNVDAVTGATVTSKAVARSINSAVAFVTGADVSSGATEWGG